MFHHSGCGYQEAMPTKGTKPEWPMVRSVGPVEDRPWREHTGTGGRKLHSVPVCAEHTLLHISSRSTNPMPPEKLGSAFYRRQR